MADYRNTIRQVNYAYAHKKNSTGQLAANNNIGYGPWDSLQEAWTNLLTIFGNESSIIPIGITVGVNDGDYVKEYWLQGGHTMANLVEKGGSSIDVVDDLTHNDSDKALSAKQGKVLKGEVDALEKSVAQLGLGNDTPTVTPPTSVTLPTSNTLEYNPDNNYVISLDGNSIATVHYPYEHTDNGTLKGYLVFKAIDRDLYYVYEHTTGSNYLFVEQKEYNELSHSEAQAIFKAGQYAVKQIIDVNGKNAAAGTPSPKGYWEHGVPSVFATFHGYPLRYNQIHETAIDAYDNGYHVLLKCDEINTIFKYRAYTSVPSPNTNNVKTGCWYLAASYSKGNANYKTYDAYFDQKMADEIGFDNTITQFDSSVDTVQKALNYLTTAVVSGNCILNVYLRDYDGSNIVSEYIGLSYTIAGPGEVTTVVLSDLEDDTPAISTDSNGIAHALIPYGATYTIKFKKRNNRQDIADHSATADTNHIDVFKRYTKQADKEMVIIQVQVKNANSLDPTYSLANKEVYIDYLNSSGTSVVTSAAITCVLNARGSIETWVEDGTTHTYSSDPIYIDRGQYYQVRLQEWSPSLTPDEQELIKSESKKRLAQDYTASFQMYYTYKKAGFFFVVEDYDGSTDLHSYTEYLCDSYDDTNHTITIIDHTDNNTKYILKYDSAEGGIVRAPYTDPTNFVLWISSSNISRVLGVGIRTSDTVNNNLEYNDYYSYGYTDCSFLIARNLVSVSKKIQDTQTSWVSLPVKYSGKAVTVFMAESQSPYSEMAVYLNTEVEYTMGNLTQHPFIPSEEQAVIMANNKTFIKNIMLVMNNSYFASVGSTVVCEEVNNTTIKYVNIFGTSQVPQSKTNNNNVIPLYCF